MSVDFNIEECQNNTSEVLFGLCDDTPPPHKPAYMCEDILNRDNWIGEVNNPNKKNILFTAVDHCISILRYNGKEDNKCDCIINYDSTIIFIELKDRQSSGWLSDASNQIVKTYEYFKANNDISNFSEIKAQIVNKQRPFFHSNYNSTIQKVKQLTENKVILNVARIINIE